MVAIAERALRVAGRARDLLLLQRAEVAARALTPAQIALCTRYHRASQRRSDVADRLREGHNAVAALRLYREAFELAAVAVAIARDGNANPEVNPDTILGPAAYDTLVELARAGKIPPLPASLQQVGPRLCETNPMVFDADTTDELLVERDNAAAALSWLQPLGRVRSLERVRMDRALILTIGSLAVVGVLAFAGMSLFGRNNLALHRPVTASGRHPVSHAPADNSGLVNGEIESTYGIHTNRGNAWVQIDLDGEHPISRVVVYNRADGWLDDALPLTLEMSEDGKTFAEVGKRLSTFTSTSPWVFEAQGRRASAIRFRSSTYIALSEVKVYEVK
jgi:hypothetical protein